MWKDVGLLGRDDLLKKEIMPRIKAGKGFIMVGQHGIGKTALLEWCYDNAEGRKTIVSASLSTRDILKKICEDWGLVVYNRDGKPANKTAWQILWMEEAILKEKGHWIFVDDIQMVKPATLQKMKAMRDRFTIVSAAVPPLKKEELKRMLWGLKQIDIKPLKNNEMMRIAEKAAVATSSTTPIREAVHAARGIPAHLFHALRGEVTPEAAKTKDEEIDISPVLMMMLAGVMVLRYVGRGVDSMSLTLLGGLGMAGAVIFRFYLFKGMRK